MKVQTEVSFRSRIHTWLLHLRMRPVLLVVGVLVVAIVVVGFLGHELGRHIQSLESWITGLGLLGMLVFVGLVVVGTSLFLPETVFGLAAGVLFGLAPGAALMLLATTLAAALQYGLAYGLLREPIRRKLGTSRISSAIQLATIGGHFRLQLLLRLVPFNQTTISYLLGASGARFPSFLAASVAMLPTIIIEVYSGYAGKHLARISTDAAHSGWTHDLVLFAGLVTLAIAVGLASRAAYGSMMRKANFRVGIAS